MAAALGSYWQLADFPSVTFLPADNDRADSYAGARDENRCRCISGRFRDVALLSFASDFTSQPHRFPRGFCNPWTSWTECTQDACKSDEVRLADSAGESTNVEIRMSKEARNQKPESNAHDRRTLRHLQHSSFVLRHSLDIRFSTFVLSHSPNGSPLRSHQPARR